MINDPEPAGLGADKPEYKWNSDEVIRPGLTCNQAARFMSAYVTSFRLLAIANKLGGIKELNQSLGRLIDLQQLAGEKSKKAGQPSKEIDAITNLGAAAAWLAATEVLDGEVNLIDLFTLSGMATDAACNIADENKDVFENGEIRFGVRSVEGGGFEIGTNIINMKDLKKAVDESGVKDIIKQYDKSKGSQGAN